MCVSSLRAVCVDDNPAVAEAGGCGAAEAVCVADGKKRETHGVGGAEGCAVADGGSGFDVADGEDAGLPGEDGMEARGQRGRCAGLDGQAVAVEGEAGADHGAGVAAGGGFADPGHGGTFVERGGVAEMDEVGREAGGADGFESGREALALAGGDGRAGDLGGAEVGKDAFAVQPAGGGEAMGDGQKVAQIDALAGHAGVDFEVDGEDGGCGRGGLLKGGDVVEGPEGGGEVEGEDAGGVGGFGGAHDEDAGGVADGGANAGGFVEVGDAKPADACVDEDRRDEGSVVAIGVGLDDGEGFDGGAGDGLDGAQVRLQAFARDLHPTLHLFRFACVSLIAVFC